MTESEVKFVPVTVNVKLALPAGAEVGLNDASAGIGLGLPPEVAGLRPLQPPISAAVTTIAKKKQRPRFIGMDKVPPGAY
jgi:hypothetical protein